MSVSACTRCFGDRVRPQPQAPIRLAVQHLDTHAHSPGKRQHRRVVHQSVNEQGPEPSHPSVARRVFEKRLGEPLTAKSRKDTDSHLELTSRLPELTNSDQREFGIEDAEGGNVWPAQLIQIVREAGRLDRAAKPVSQILTVECRKMSPERLAITR